MKKIILILLIFCSNKITLQCQNVAYEKYDYLLISPSQVNRFYAEQIIDYIAYYESAIEKAIQEVELKRSQILELTDKQKISNRDRIKISNLEELINFKELEISEIEFYKQEWEDTKLVYEKINLKFLLSENTCYEIVGIEKNYSPNEYKIEKYELDGNHSWIEILPSKHEFEEEVRIKTSSSSTKKIKRIDKNCISNNPDDCITWETIEVPATFTTIQEKNLFFCPDGFYLANEKCKRERTIKAESGSIEIKVLDINNDNEILVLNNNKVKCKE